jgi:DNA repair exonuclease SbcCD ATPase subunit
MDGNKQKMTDSAQIAQLKREIQTLKESNAELRGSRTALDSENSDLRTKVSQLTSKLESANRSLTDSASRVNDAANKETESRLEAWGKAKPYLPKSLADAQDPAMSAKEIYKAAIAHNGITLDSEDPSDVEVKAAFLAMKQATERKVPKPLSSTRKIVADTINAGSVTDIESVRQKQNQKQKSKAKASKRAKNRLLVATAIAALILKKP